MRQYIVKTIFLFVILVGCSTTDPIETYSFSEKNDPTHIFTSNINVLHDSIVSFFEIGKQSGNKHLSELFYFYFPQDKLISENRHEILFSEETIKDSLFGNRYFRGVNTSNDIYVHCFGEVWNSKLYHSQGKPLEYRTPFIIKLKEINDSTTQVSIVAENPVVLNGISGYGPHGAVARETSVPSSTIEEYTLLLYVAEKMGDNSLAPLKLPVRN